MDPVTAKDLAEFKKFIERTPLRCSGTQHKIEVVDGVAYFLHPEGHACMSMPEEDLEAIANFVVKEESWTS